MDCTYPGLNNRYGEIWLQWLTFQSSDVFNSLTAWSLPYFNIYSWECPSATLFSTLGCSRIYHILLIFACYSLYCFFFSCRVLYIFSHYYTLTTSLSFFLLSLVHFWCSCNLMIKLLLYFSKRVWYLLGFVPFYYPSNPQHFFYSSQDFLYIIFSYAQFECVDGGYYHPIVVHLFEHLCMLLLLVHWITFSICALFLLHKLNKTLNM